MRYFYLIILIGLMAACQDQAKTNENTAETAEDKVHPRARLLNDHPPRVVKVAAKSLLPEGQTVSKVSILIDDFPHPTGFHTPDTFNLNLGAGLPSGDYAFKVLLFLENGEQVERDFQYSITDQTAVIAP